jgi:hypothetical protein
MGKHATHRPRRVRTPGEVFLCAICNQQPVVYGSYCKPCHSTHNRERKREFGALRILRMKYDIVCHELREAQEEIARLKNNNPQQG